MRDSAPIDRRSLLASVAAASGALTLGFAIPLSRAAGAAHAAPEITAWIVIEPDNSTVIRIAKSEMGQGISTALPLLVAEELECDWSKVKAEFVSPEENVRRGRAWGDMSTGASRSVRASEQALRRAGATARELLIAAAAARWEVAASQCRAQDGIITHPASGRSVSFAQVATAAAQIPPPRETALKPPSQWRLAGRPHRRLDVGDKVQGKTIYGIDVRVPGMLHAAVIQAPLLHSKLRSLDASKLAGMKGVRQLVRLDDAVAVVADSWWRAKTALDSLAIEWQDRAGGSLAPTAIREHIRGGLAAPDAGVGRKDGDFAAAFAQAAKQTEAEYEVPFLAHATMEPQNATAHVRGNAVEVWAPTQNGEAALAAAAQAAGVAQENVVIHRTMLGGGFGRRGLTQDFVSLAVRIAKEVDAPVKVLWSREEDMRHDFYRPMAMARMSAGLDAAGKPLAWHVRLSGPSVLPVIPGRVDRHFQAGFLDDMPYDVPNYLVEHALRTTPVPVGFWRCVNHTQNCFFKECFLDELAHAANEDPYQYRRSLLRFHPRAQRFLAVLDAAAERAGWGVPPRAGIHRGIALNDVYGTYTAAVVEVSVGDAVKVHRVTSAIDCGTVVNPLTVERQVDSATVWALTAALHGRITVGEGGIEQSNFHDYPMLRLAEMPQIETVIVPSDGAFQGVGEPPVAVVAPALCNAVFAATGKRIRSLPLSNHDLKKA
jgi:isoquinoline 1-oxidoreductase beta subunit